MKKLKLTKQNIILYAITSFVIILGDQLSKIIISQSMQLSSSQTIIDNFMYFTYARNKGAAWSMLEGNITLFLVVAFFAGLGMIYYFTKTTKEEALTRFGLILTFSGMIGNVIDRISFGYVRDFIDFVIFGYDFPIFNIADMAVVIGVGLIILEVIIGEFRHEKHKN